jgi:hypothetical protein
MKKVAYVRVDFLKELKERARAPHTSTWHLNRILRQCYSFCWRMRNALNKANAGRLWGRGNMGNPWHRRRPLPAAPLVVRRTLLRPLRRCALRVLNRGAQVVARGTALCASHIAQAVASLCITGT